MNKTYTANGRKIVLEIDPTVVAVRYREPAPHSMRAEVARVHGLGPFNQRYEVPEEKYTILPVGTTDGTAMQPIHLTMERLESAREVARVAPVFKVGVNRAIATDRLLVGFSGNSVEARHDLQRRGLQVLEQREGEFLVQLGEYEDPFDVAGELAHNPDVEYAEPDFSIIGSHTARSMKAIGPATSDDPLATSQYALKITGASLAHAIQKGSPSVRIAILDEGVDTVHEDLRTAIAGSYDATDDDEYQEPLPTDSHGTCCAGLAAASGFNDLGVRGIGTGCSILAVRIAYSDPIFPNHWKTSTSWIRRGIDWSWENGAAVLSNSWGGGLPSTAISNAFERARTEGRNGRGSVIVIAAGNSDSGVEFPATVENVIAVSASNQYDEPKTKTSKDGEDWWGSCFGPEVTLAAPGVGHYTTDNSGAAGYGPENYIGNFNGTSSATPIVAGAAGLVLSAHPDLTEAEVRQILRSTTDKVGADYDENGHHPRMGFGRLNVFRAVQKALELTGAVSA